MNEQIYAQSTYATIHRAEVNVVEQITNVFDRINEKIHRLYAVMLDSLADRIIARFDL